MKQSPWKPPGAGHCGDHQREQPEAKPGWRHRRSPRARGAPGAQPDSGGSQGYGCGKSWAEQDGNCGAARPRGPWRRPRGQTEALTPVGAGATSFPPQTPLGALAAECGTAAPQLERRTQQSWLRRPQPGLARESALRPAVASRDSAAGTVPGDTEDLSTALPSRRDSHPPRGVTALLPSSFLFFAYLSVCCFVVLRLIFLYMYVCR